MPDSIQLARLWATLGDIKDDIDNKAVPLERFKIERMESKE